MFAICVVPVLATMAMGLLAARQSFSHSTVSLLPVQPLMGHKIFAGGTSLISLLFCFPEIPHLSPGPWHCSEQDPCSAWHLVLVSACAVTYGSCEGDINWEARVSFHGSACLLLGKGMELWRNLTHS